MKYTLYKKNLNYDKINNLKEEISIIETDNPEKFMDNITKCFKESGFKIDKVVNHNTVSIEIETSDTDKIFINLTPMYNEIQFPKIFSYTTLVYMYKITLDKFKEDIICNNDEELEKAFNNYLKIKEELKSKYSFEIITGREFHYKERITESVFSRNYGTTTVFTTFFEILSKEEYMEKNL